MVKFGVVLSLIVLLSACSGEESGIGSQTTQVVAKVNGEEVTIHQLNQLLSKVRVPADESARDALKKKALDNLIEQTLVLQAAKKVNLDRTPEVLSAIEESKRKVLIEGYIKRTLQGVGKPSQAEIQSFYEEQSRFFAHRKLFIYTSLAISAKTDELDAMVKKVKSSKSVVKLATELSKKKVVYKIKTDAKASEKVPTPILRSLEALKVGDLGYSKMSDGLLVIELHQVIDQPVTLEEATPLIAKRLFMDKQKKASSKLVESLKEVAKVEYIGVFAPKP